MVTLSRLTAAPPLFLIFEKKIICFYIWLLGDILWFPLDYAAGTYGRAALDFVQVLLAICGILEWKKASKF